MKTEKVIIAQIFKQNGSMNMECDDMEANQLELLGFLRTYTKVLEERLVYEMIDNMDEEDSKRDMP